MEVNGAVIYLDEENVEDLIIEYLEEMESHPAFDLESIRIMPDTHPEPNSRTIIGFTMPLNGRIIPNIVGNDIGCGISGVNLGSENPFKEIPDETVDQRVRERVPMGKGPKGYKSERRTYYNVKEMFPYDTANERLQSFIEQNNLHDSELQEFLDSGGYDIDYFKRLCKRVGADMTQSINGVGTLGSGNHFIEFGEATSSGEFWMIVHSGSRALGQAVAYYWQDKANKYRDAENIKTTLLENCSESEREYLKFDLDSVSDQDLIEWMTGGKGESFIDYDQLRDDFRNSEPEKIEKISNKLKEAIPTETNRTETWDYLEDEEAYGYYRDMIFCQIYATENRRKMLFDIADEFDIDVSDSDFIDSPHNIVDFTDSVIRKGATNAQEGEKAIIPFNMRRGAVLVEGKGNEEWNNSVSHGAGRTGSRGEARDNIAQSEAEEVMEGVYSSEIPVEEAPQAYKNPDMIESRIRETVDIIDKIEPFINFKAPEHEY